MSSLRELQAGVRAALLADDERGVAPDVVDDGLSASARLAVYRHHVFTTLSAALEATYPVVCRLVDRRFFGWIADQYVRAHPCREALAVAADHVPLPVEVVVARGEALRI